MTGHTQETELIEQLFSNRRSVQIQAIVKLARAGSSEKSLEALVPFVNSDDREISFFAAQAAGKVSKKIGVDFSSFLAGAQANLADDSWKIESFLQPEKAKTPELLALVREKQNSIPEMVLPAVGVFLAKHGNLDDANFIEKQLLSENSNLVIPFINAAEKIAPSVLYRALPKLLASTAPLVRSMSIAALRRVDPEEAERHFSDLLSSRNPEDRLAAIGIAFLFPFGRVRDYILSMLPDEQDKDVLKAFKAILASNPEMDCALRILDYLDTAETDQKARISPIFKAVCQAMITAQLITPEEGHPDEILKIWKARRLNQFLDNLELQLTVADANKKRTILAWIEKNRSHPKVQEFIQRLALNPQTEDSYKALINKSIESPAKLASSFAVADENGPAAGDMQAKLKKLRSVEIDNFNEHKNWIIKEAEKGNEVIRVEALKVLLKFFPHKKLIDLANDALSSSSAALKTQGLKILEKLDPDSLKEKISTLLTDKDEGFRVRVVRFALKHKQDQAIEEIKNLLKSPKQRFRANAVNFMALCPFKSIYDSLMEQLDLEDNVVIVRQILTILMNNPSRIVLKGLDSITKTSNPAIAMAISQARNDLFDIISTSGETRSSAELSGPEDATDKPYSVKNVRSIRGKGDWQPSYKAGKTKAAAATGEPRWQPNWGLIIPGAIILIVLAMSPIMYLSTKDTDRPLPKDTAPSDFRAPERVKASHVDIPDEFRMNMPCTLDVTIERVISDTTLVVVYDNRQIMVNFETPYDKKVAEGGLINVTMVPYRVNPNGIIMAQGRELITR